MWRMAMARSLRGWFGLRYTEMYFFPDPTFVRRVRCEWQWSGTLPRGVHSSKPASPRIRLHDALEKTFLQCIMIALFV